jgi:anti-sigma regulatory factor (Ser/Thr protein kinase)
MSPDDLRIPLPRRRDAARSARTALEEWLGGRLGGDELDRAKLVTTELVANAYDHGEGAIELRAALRDQRLLIEVVDEGEGAAIEVRQAGRDGRGRGLRIVDGLAERWGAHEGTTHVWAELPLGP